MWPFRKKLIRDILDDHLRSLDALEGRIQENSVDICRVGDHHGDRLAELEDQLGLESEMSLRLVRIERAITRISPYWGSKCLDLGDHLIDEIVIAEVENLSKTVLFPLESSTQKDPPDEPTGPTSEARGNSLPPRGPMGE